MTSREMNLGRGAEMISQAIGFVDSDIARGRKGTNESGAHLLALAATPTFATMALLVAVHGGGMPDILCSDAQDASPLTGLVPMYLLMSAFHLGPWLKLISRRKSGADRSSRIGLCHRP
jgi:hypothetical protein